MNPLILSIELKERLVQYLTTYITEARNSRFNDVISKRMGHLAIVLEDIFQPHNASAVLRSCDCFGIQNVHIIENHNHYAVNPDVALGSSKWVTMHRYNQTDFNTPEAFQSLRSKGYKIVATTPHMNDCNLEDLSIDKPIALIFGTEKTGLTQWAIDNADAWVKIPMYGFTESFNISVCAALCMYHLSSRIRKEVPNYGLSEEEKRDIYIDWLKASIRKQDLIVKEFDSKYYQKA